MTSQGDFPRTVILRRFHPAGCRFEVADPVEAYRVEAYGGEEMFLGQFLAILEPEDVVFDIGACVGLVTVHAALRAAQVVAFEPDSELRARLQHNLSLNGLDHVQVVDWAVADRRGTATLYTDGAGGDSPSLRPTGRRGTVEVRTDSIDRALEAGDLPWPTVIKMDIEGAEILALRGMRRLLDSDRAPRALFLELHPEFLPLFDSSAEEVLRLLEDHGYRVRARSERQAQIHLWLEKGPAAASAGPLAPDGALEGAGRLDAEALLRRSAERLAAYQNRHRGERCVIIGNGPSLNRMDLGFLKHETTFGMNRIYLGFDRWDFRPTYYVAVNPLVIEQSAQAIAALPMPKFLSLHAASFIPEAEDVVFLRSLAQPLFSRDPRQGLWEGHTVTYVALQLAYFMGFDQVVLIGVDHHYTTSGPPNAEVVSKGPDPNHFHPEYFGQGTRWHLPDLARSEAAYRLAREAFEADGRAVVDATLDGRLTIFPKADYRSLFGLPTRRQEPTAAEPDLPKPDRKYKVSALVSTYNAERFLRGLLEDLEAQTIADELEIIVVDSGSQQNEGAIVEAFQQRYDNIVYLRTERETLYAAWNRAVQVARGEYLTVANTDDRHRPDALERMARALDQNPQVALVYADSLKTRQPNRPFGEAEVSGAFRWPDFDPDLLLRACYIGPQPMWRRDLHERYGLFNPAYRSAGDYEFWLRLAHGGERFLHLPETLGLYYDNPQGIEHSDQALNEAEAELARARYWPADRPRRPLRVSWQRDVGLNQPLLRSPSTPTRPVNICMVTYNRLDYTRRVLEGLERNPPGCPYVLTVVDNGSTDGTADWLREQAARGRIHNLYLLPENVGVSRAQNLAWAAEPEMHYLKLDNDMLPQRPGWLLPMVLLAESLPEVGAVAYNVEPVSYPLTIRRGWPVRVKGHGNLGGACLLIPHRVHQRVGFWCEDYGLYGEEDADMGFRLRRLGLLNVYMPDERAFFHLPSGRAARIDPVTLQAVDGDEDPAYREHKDAWRRKNLRERKRLQRNLRTYQEDLGRCRVERAPFDAERFRVPAGPSPRPKAGGEAFDLEAYTLETATRLHDQGDLDAAMVCFAWLGLAQSRRRASGARPEVPSVALYLGNEVSGEVRLGLVAEPLRRLGYRVHLASAFAPEDAGRHDLFVFSRPHLNPAVYEGLKAVALRGKPLLVDLDDLFHAIPPDHPGYASVGPGNPDLLSLLESILQLATWLTVATPQLADFYARWARGVTVIPNGWSAANPHWQSRRPRRETVTLGWAGTVTHRQDVLLMRPAVMRVLRQHPQARLVIGGDPEVYRLFSGVPQEQRRFVPWMAYRDYPRLLGEFDILLAPLRDNAFNRAKSDIKLVDAGAAGIPWVASPLPAYRAWGAGGLFAETRRQWTKALGSLIADPALRQRLGEEGRRKAQEREAEALARQWAGLFASLGYPPAARPISTDAPGDLAARLLAQVLESEDPLAALEAHREQLDRDFLALVAREAERARLEGEPELAEGLEALAEVVREMLAVPAET